MDERLSINRVVRTEMHSRFPFQNMHPNHRANDVITIENSSFNIVGKFVYGPIEVAALTGEKVIPSKKLCIL